MKDKTTLIVLGCVLILLPLSVRLGYGFIEDIKLDRALGDPLVTCLEPRRGRILAGGEVMARSDTCYSFHVDCMAIKDSLAWRRKIEEAAPGLDRLLPREDTSGWLPAFVSGREREEKYLPVADHLRKDQVDSIRALPLFRLSNGGGAIIEIQPVRVHPYGDLAGSTVGTIGEDMHWTGLEGRYDYALYGVDGKKRVRVGRYEGRYLEKTEFFLSARNGDDIETTIAVPLQVAADSILRSVIRTDARIRGGCLVAMSAETGAIRAICNLSETGEGIGESVNWAVAHPVEPGGVADAMGYAALLSDGLVGQAGEEVRLGGVARLVRLCYADDSQTYVDRLRSFLPGIDFDLDMAGNRIPAPGTPEWTAETLPELASGRGMEVTPLSLLTFFSTLANGGRMVRPYLVDRIVDEDGVILAKPAPVACGEIPEDVAEALRQWLLSAGSVPGVALLSGVSRGTATCVAFTGDNPGYSLICTLFMDDRQDSRARTLAERTVLDMIDNLRNR